MECASISTGVRALYDILIQGGMILDGTGNPWYHGDVGISGGRITAIGRIGDREARETVDARGLAVCPGFIDMHSHSDLDLLVNPLAEAKIRQGVTTLEEATTAVMV